EAWDTIRLARAGNLTDARERLDNCGADAELIALARKCLDPEPVHRPTNAEEVARAVTSYRESVQARLQQAEIERAAAQARAEEEQKRRHAEQATTRAERRRRRMTAVAAAAVVLLMAGAGSALLWYQKTEAVRLAQHGRRIQSIEEALKQTGEI